MRKRLSVYTKPSRFNLVLSLEQYKILLKRKAYAKEYDERVKYKDLVENWGIKQHHMASAVYRGIKQYDDRIKEEERVSNIRRQIAARFMEKRNECSTVGLWSNTTTQICTHVHKASLSGKVDKGSLIYSPFSFINHKNNLLTLHR